MSTLKVTNINAADGISALSIANGTGVVGANKFTNLAGTGAPDFPNGLTLAGNTTGGDISGVTLDDYEEGTWTPSLGGNTTYTAQSGTYTKISNLVFVKGIIAVDTLGTGSVRRISGLPFTSENPASGGYVGNLGISYYSSAATNVAFATVAVSANATHADVHYNTGAAAVLTFNGTFFGNSTRIDFSGCYRVV